MQQGRYIETIDTSQRDLKHFQDFLYRHFKKSEHYDQMRPVSNQPGRFFATAKTHKFIQFSFVSRKLLIPILIVSLMLRW